MQTTSEIVLRLARPRDLRALTKLMLDFSMEVNAPLTEKHIEHALIPMLKNPEIGDIWVLDNGNLIGYLVITWGWGIESGGKEALVDELFVAKEFRGQGLATAMLEAALERAWRLETKAVFLETEANNPKSRELYQRLGFEVETSVWLRALAKLDD